MSHITFIRHGQANSQAKSEAEYDRLSPLGHQQAAWLGQHLKAANQHHMRLYSGSLRRQIETAEGLDTGLIRIEDPRLNELEYFTLAQALEAEHGIPAPTEPSEMSSGEGPAIAVTSGGVIAMSMRLHLNLDIPTMARVGLAIMNSSMHRFFPVGGTWSPVMFNAIPHLEAPDRHAAQTHV